MEHKKSLAPKQGLGEQMASPLKYDPKNNEQLGTDIKNVDKMEKIKKKLDEIKKKIVKKYPFTISLSILPAASVKKFEEDEGMLPEEVEKKPIHLMMIIPEEEFKNIPKKIKPEVIRIIIESKQNVWMHFKTPVDVWNYGLDSKYEYLDAIGGSFPLHDNGFLGLIRVATIHKNLVLRKFDKYVATYGIYGSLVRGTAGKDSDVDTVVIIDDTDVKKMPTVQLIERLRGWIFDFVREATALAGVKNVLNVQVWLLTDFWDRVKDAEAVAFTFIRDGVPMHDRGTFLPWKMLLQRGKIKPSPEAVDKFMKIGEQNEDLVNRRLMDAMIDIYWGVVTPTQALMMLAGHAPPPPKTLVQDAKRLFVDKEKIMGQKELKILEKIVNYYKEYEHGKLKKITGKQVDEILKESNEYEKKIKEMRKKLESVLVEQEAEKIDSEVFGLLKNIFGNKSKELLMKDFEKELVKKGMMKKRFIGVLKDISSIKRKVKGNKLSQIEVDNIKRDAVEMIKELIDYSQRKELIAAEKGVMQVDFGDKKGELVLTDSGAFFIEGGRIMKVSNKKLVMSERKEFEEAIVKTKDRTKVVLDSSILKVLEKELGDFSVSV